ncbi:MAG: hypothetical protein ACM3TR_02315 [Caulobacteraceae bacterium]
MSNKKRTGTKKVTVVVITIILGVALLFGTAYSFFGSKADADATKGVSNENKVIQASTVKPIEQPGNSGSGTKYLTVSQDNNVIVSVNYLSPAKEDKNNLTFEISVDTHSGDLTQYANIRKYLELQTDAGIKVHDGFDWKVESSESHHLSGILTIKNDIDGKPIVDSNTKSFKLLLKNIGGGNVREHTYEGDRL